MRIESFNLRMFQFENVRPAANENVRENNFHDLRIFTFLTSAPDANENVRENNCLPFENCLHVFKLQTLSPIGFTILECMVSINWNFEISNPV